MKNTLTTFLLFAIVSCAQHSKKPQPSNLIGKWINGIDTSVYLPDGMYIHITPGHDGDTSVWQLKNGILTVTPLPYGIEREYDILEYHDSLYSYRCTNRVVDDSIYTERRVK